MIVPENYGKVLDTLLHTVQALPLAGQALASLSNCSHLSPSHNPTKVELKGKCINTLHKTTVRVAFHIILSIPNDIILI